jgi:hypothetical protein
MTNKFFIFFTALFLMVYAVKAQNCTTATYTTTPSVFTAEDQVVLNVDISTCTTLAGTAGAPADVYLWMFNNGADAVGQGQWTNSSESFKMTYSGTYGRYTYTFTPTILFGKTSAQIGTSMGFLVKSKTGSAQTGDITLAVEPLVYTPVVIRTFPVKFTQDDIVTIYFDQNFTGVPSTLRSATEIYMYTDIKLTDNSEIQLSCYSDDPCGTAGQVPVKDNPRLRFVNEGNGIYSLTMIPKTFYGLTGTQQIKDIKIHIRSRNNPFGPGAPAPAASMGDKIFSPVIAD